MPLRTLKEGASATELGVLPCQSVINTETPKESDSVVIEAVDESSKSWISLCVGQRLKSGVTSWLIYYDENVSMENMYLKTALSIEFQGREFQYLKKTGTFDSPVKFKPYY